MRKLRDFGREVREIMHAIDTFRTSIILVTNSLKSISPASYIVGIFSLVLPVIRVYYTLKHRNHVELIVAATETSQLSRYCVARLMYRLTCRLFVLPYFL